MRFVWLRMWILSCSGQRLLFLLLLLGSLSCKFVSYFKPDVLGQGTSGTHNWKFHKFHELFNQATSICLYCIWFLASDIWKADLSGHLSITSWITWYQQKPSWHGEGLHDCWGRTFLRNLADCWQVALSKLGVHNGFKYSFCRQFLWILWASWIFCV